MEFFKSQEKMVAFAGNCGSFAHGFADDTGRKQSGGSIYLYPFLMKAAERKYRDFESILAISGGLLLLFMIFDAVALLYISLFIQISGLAIPALRRIIARAWFALAEMLGFINARVLLILFFYLLLTPMAIIRRLTGRTQYPAGNWVVRNHIYGAEDFSHPF